MTETRLLAAIGRPQLLEVFRLAARQPFIVFGTLDWQVMSRFKNKHGAEGEAGQRGAYWKYVSTGRLA